WPDYRRPTTEECRVVEQALSKHHRERARPEKQPDASHTVCGCGEVEHLIDGLLHVLLSKKTSGGNANKALIGLFEAYGSHYKTVPWNAVRLGSVETLKGAIRSGGLADKKSREIKQILNIAYNEDSRRRRLSSLMYTEDDMLQSLDYLRELDTSNIYNKLIQFEGVGQKSVACVLLLNCRRPVLATDTHVFDISMRLRWGRAPFLATRVKVFAHLDVRVPDKLKYSIHQLMVEHGRTCTRC
ncbi:DNA glycosylase, partial [Tothia fuscella]